MYCSEMTVVALVFLHADRISCGDLICIFTITVEISRVHRLICIVNLTSRVVRIMTFFDPRSHSEPLLKSLRLQKLSDIIHLEILSFVYQWYHKLSPSCFVNYFTRVSSIHSYNSRQSQIDNLFIYSVHTTRYGIRSLSCTGPKLWNSLSIAIEKIKPFSGFCQHIKNSVIDGYNTFICQRASRAKPSEDARLVRRQRIVPREECYMQKNSRLSSRKCKV